MEEKNIVGIEFAKQNIPAPTEGKVNDDNVLVKYGDDNNYPAFLLECYSNSPIHQAIVNGKATYIYGLGLSNEGKIIDIEVNPTERINEFINKLIKDLLLFNYFAVEVVFNNLNAPIEYHWVPAQKIRTNKSKTKFWYCDSSDFKRGDKIEYERYIPRHNKDSKSKIYFYDSYFPSMNSVYPQVEYSATIKSIVTDMAIRSFNLNNIKNHFSVSSLITFFNGDQVNAETRNQVQKQIQNTYSGENGGKILLQWQREDGKAPEITNLSAGDWDKAYSLIGENVADDIYRGHQVTSPMLFGVKTQGQLGGTTELETAYEIFKNNYILSKRAELEFIINNLFSEHDALPKGLKFADKPLFNTQLDDATKTQVMTINELRALNNLPPLVNGDRLLNEAPVQTNEKPDGKELTEQDFELVQHLGIAKEEFEVVDNDKEVFATPSIRDLFITMYDYIVRPEVGGSDIIKGSRNFCKRVINSNRYYSREDIQKMSEIFGYDVFKHCGGWYHNPKTGENEKKCRHEWKQVLLRKK